MSSGSGQIDTFSDDELRDSGARKGAARSLQQLLDGDIPVLQSSAAKLRLALKKKAITYLRNLPKGELGLLIIVPATQQGGLVVETTSHIPPGIVVGALEGMQGQLLRPDKRLAAAITQYKAVQAAVDSLGEFLCVPGGRGAMGGNLFLGL